jgi:hypothetical protein
MSHAPALPRRGRSVLASLVAAVLGAAGVTVAIDVISVQTGHPALIYPYRQIASQLRAARWDDTAIMAVACAFAFVGLLLVVAAVVPGRLRVLAVAAPAPEVAVGTSRRSFGRAIRSAALGVDGISSVRVRLRRRSVKLKAKTPLRDRSGLGDQVKDAVTARLDMIAPQRTLRVKVRLRTKEN